MAKLNGLTQNNMVMPEDNPVLQGNFGPVDQELEIVEFDVVGQIPADLNGTLLRAGPNPVNPGPNHHWFLGDAMIHGISLSNGVASAYRNRWVRTEAIEEKLGLEAAPVKMPKLMIQGSGNVNIIQHGKRILALPEIGLPYEMDTALNTKGMFDYDGALNSSMTAHPKIDGKTGEMLFFGYDLFPPYLKFHTVDALGNLVRSIDIDLPEAVMMHDFGVTESRVVFMDLPIVGDFGVAEAGYTMPFRWSDSHQARLGILDRSATKDEVQWINIDPCYVFHPLNSFDDGTKIVMDVVKYQKMFTSDADGQYEKGSKLVRWTIDTENNVVHETLISEIDQEFPRVNPNVECYPHRYGYVLKAGGELGFLGLIKYDFESQTNVSHDLGDHCAGGEPVFVPKQVGSLLSQAEDDGYILSVVYNGETKLSELHIIDAHDFTAKPLAIVKLNARVPFGFHGNFVSS